MHFKYFLVNEKQISYTSYIRLYIRAYWSKRRVVPPVLFRTNYYLIEILHGVTAISLTYHPHHAKLQVLPILYIGCLL